MMKIMYKKGKVIHYGDYTAGFQLIRLQCGRIVKKWEMKLDFEDWAGQTRFCQTCLKNRRDSNDK